MICYFTDMFYSRKCNNYVESFENDNKVLANRRFSLQSIMLHV